MRLTQSALLNLTFFLCSALALPQDASNTAGGNAVSDQDETVFQEMSIEDMIGPSPIVVFNTTNFNAEYAAILGPDSSNSTDSPVDGSTVRRGIVLPPYGCGPNDDPCKCQPKRFDSIRWVTSSSSKISGAVHRISQPLCPPGTITKSFTYSYSYQLSVQAGPDLKQPFIKAIDKLGIRAGFSYTWGHAQTTAYTVQCNDPQNGHPCVEIFTPDIGIITGVAYTTVEVPGGKICSRGQDSQMTIHVPIVESPSCSGSGQTCGASGVYDSCYYLGDRARQACPRSNLGPTPKQHVCPANLD